MILPNVCEISRNSFRISRKFVVQLVSRNFFCIILFKYLFGKMILPKFSKILQNTFVFREISSYNQFREWRFAKFCQILFMQNNFAKIFQDFARVFSYFATFRRITSFENEILRDFIKYIVLRKKFREISSYTFLQNDFAEMLRNFAKSFSYFAKFHRTVSFAKQNFAKFCTFCLRKFYVIIKKNSARLWSKNFAKFCFRKFSRPP